MSKPSSPSRAVVVSLLLYWLASTVAASIAFGPIAGAVAAFWLGATLAFMWQ